MDKFSDEVIDTVSKIDLVKYVSQYVTLEQKGVLYVGLCPFHKEDTPSFTIYPETNSFYCWGCGAAGTIIDFVRRYYHYGFNAAIQYLLNYSNIDPNSIHEKPKILAFLRKYVKKQKRKILIPHVILPDDIMNQYEQVPIFTWLAEGITQDAIDKYQVRYNPEDNSIVFPIWDNNGNIIAIKRRTLYKNYKELGIPKYQYYQKIGALDFLYGLNFNRKYIEEKNEVICYESEKSVMKADGFGIKNVIAVCTHDISKQQIDELLKLKTSIVIAFDKDIKFEQIRKICKPLLYFTNVYIVYDRNEILKDKDAPVDEGVETWNKLYSERRKLIE
ncbi:DNA primase [Ruminococcaceae bacterium BL-6]|nr:DNA primase [Ruminococcaceae bacterium BL-6]